MPVLVIHPSKGGNRVFRNIVNPPAHRKVFLLSVIVALLIFAGLHLYRELKVAGEFGFPVDDAWIHCQFARNIAEGNGMSYNPGVPASGSTAPLWTFILALPHLLKINPVIAAKLISLILYFLSCILVCDIIFFILGEERFAFLGGVVLAMFPPLMWGALSGMEVALSVFLTLLGIHLHLRHRQDPGPRRYLSTVVFALASLARPESMMLVFFALFDTFWTDSIERRKDFSQLGRSAIIHLLLFCALLTPCFMLNYSASGSIFPNTFAAKRGGGLLEAISQRDPEELGRTFFLYPRMYLSELLELCSGQSLLLYWLSFLGAGAIVVRAFEKTKGKKALIIFVTFFLYPVFVAILSPSRTALIWIVRYMGNLLPIYVVMGVVGCHSAIWLFKSSLAHFWTFEDRAGKVGRAVFWGIVFLICSSLVVEQYENSKFYAQGVQNINTMQVRIGRWIQEHTSPESVLAVNDIGAIAYFSRRTIVDLVGLVTPTVLPYHERPGGIFEFIAERKPDYVVIFPDWFPGLPEREELMPVFSVTLDRNVVCGGDTMVVYETVWRRQNRVRDAGHYTELTEKRQEGSPATAVAGG